MSFRKMKNDQKLFMVSWVDDIDIAGANAQDIEELKKFLAGQFKMGDRGKLDWFLGMQIRQVKDCKTCEPETFIGTVTEKVIMQDSNPLNNPAENNFKLVKATEHEQLIDETKQMPVRFSLLHSKTN